MFDLDKFHSDHLDCKIFDKIEFLDINKLNEEIDAYFKTCDDNKDEMLTLKEVQDDDCIAFEAKVHIKNFTVEDIEWIFPDADANDDGFLTRDEVVAELAKAGIVQQ